MDVDHIAKLRDLAGMLRRKSEQAIAFTKEYGKGEGAEVVLQIKGRWGNRTSCHLLGRRGPTGHILADSETKGFIIASFGAEAVLKVAQEMEAEIGRFA